MNYAIGEIPCIVEQARGARVLKNYDLYLFAADKDLICGWHRFEAADDKAALDVADALVIRPPAELWHEITLVKRWEGSP